MNNGNQVEQPALDEPEKKMKRESRSGPLKEHIFIINIH
jgi:hypothetical protein